MDELNTHTGSIDLNAWLTQPAGNYVRAWEQSLLDKVTADIFGFNALQIGLPQLDCLAASRMPNKWIANDVPSPNAAHPIALVHDFNDLPFDANSLDLVVLPHVLEFASDPHQILREVARVLIPEGRLIVCGMNKASLWGLRQRLSGMSAHRFYPADHTFISFFQLKDWLSLLNMEVSQSYFGCYAPPFNNTEWLQRFHFLENAGQRWWPVFGGAYVIHAIKRVAGMRLIGPAWKTKRVSTADAVAATHRHHE
jgi:SAM-dependent methyltransferase